MRLGTLKALAIASHIILVLLTMSFAQTVTDFEGNIYNTITIGTQKWMKENLKATKYLNGDPIGTTTPAALDIKSEVTPKYQWAPLAKDSLVAVYGRLYTWKAATDSRSVCPAEWHVPSNIEWKTLVTFLGGETTAGKKIKESGTAHWDSMGQGDNSSNFTGLPVSIREPNGTVYPAAGCWWSSTLFFSTYAYYERTYTNNDKVSIDLGNDMNAGISIRCLYGTTTELNKNENSPAFKFSPDLGNGNFLLETEKGNPKLIEIRVFNLSGKIIHSKTGSTRNGFLTLDLSTLPKGVFLVKTSAGKSTFFGKIFVQ
jgi:uncharacterized protein (TIGR02145 family)